MGAGLRMTHSQGKWLTRPGHIDYGFWGKEWVGKPPILFEKASMKVEDFTFGQFSSWKVKDLPYTAQKLTNTSTGQCCCFLLFCLPLCRGDGTNLICTGEIWLLYVRERKFLVSSTSIKHAHSTSEIPRETETHLNFWGFEIRLQILNKNHENKYYLAVLFWNIWAYDLLFKSSPIINCYRLGMASKDNTSCDPTAL